MSKACSPSQRRFAIAIGLAILFGLANVALLQPGIPGIWNTPLAWAIVTDRFVIGILVGLSGAYLRHPMFGFPIPPVVRGGCLGVFASLPLACSLLLIRVPGTPDWTVFWVSLLSGATIGLVADILATRFGGEGEKLLK